MTDSSQPDTPKVIHDLENLGNLDDGFATMFIQPEHPAESTRVPKPMHKSSSKNKSTARKTGRKKEPYIPSSSHMTAIRHIVNASKEHQQNFAASLEQQLLKTRF
jgi:hypothetical protein